jgi:aminoglycoside phosphotransferase (APT) family kinase protein
VGLLIPKGAVEPTLVVKMPRLAGDLEGIAREAAILNTLREASPNASETVPRVLAFEAGERPVLVETALAGPLVTPAMLRAAPSRYVDAVVHWLLTLSAARRNGGEQPSYQRLLEEPLQLLEAWFPPPGPEADLVARTLELTEPLREAGLRPLLEHGDLSHPNLIWLDGSRVGVVDWELGEEQGLPLHDLVFFLTYATFALRRARTADERLAAFHDAFFARGGWARARIAAYARELALERELLTPLFVSCWARSVARLAVRIAGEEAEPMSEEAADWIRRNRYHALWRHTIAHADGLAW